MSKRRLRIYYGPDDCRSVTLEKSPPAKTAVDVPLSELLGPLVDAAAQQRTWIDDFRDEEVTISTDLYEIILAYQHYRRPSA